MTSSEDKVHTAGLEEDKSSPAKVTTTEKTPSISTTEKSTPRVITATVAVQTGKKVNYSSHFKSQFVLAVFLEISLTITVNILYIQTNMNTRLKLFSWQLWLNYFYLKNIENYNTPSI